MREEFIKTVKELTKKYEETGEMTYLFQLNDKISGFLGFVVLDILQEDL